MHAQKLDTDLIEKKEIASLTYIKWNNEIAKCFFNPEKAGMRVWFSIEQELINKIAQKNSVDPNDFIKAIKQGPDWINRPGQTICSKASAVFKDWRDKGPFEYPPYIAYLALFVLAVNHRENGSFSEGDYYGRLNALVDGSLSTSHFKPTLPLWDDLENWSQRDKNGDFGEFYNDTVGKDFYVGIPSYQVVLRTEDKSGLSKIFWQMGWDSESNPTEEEVLSSLKGNTNLLSNKTSRRIERGEADFLSILTDRILEELREYNEDEEQPDNKNQESYKRGSIETCLEIDETAQKAEFYFRCKKKTGLPEEKIILKNNGSEWETLASSSNISQKIENFNIDPLEKDLSVQAGKYNFFYKGSKYKVFTPADKLELSDWISGQRYSPGKPFYLAVHNSLSSKVQQWGKLECDKWQKLDFDGVPEKWHLFKISGVNGDKRIKQDIPALSIDTKLRIKLVNGIRPSEGNKFFNFAPPKIYITGGVKQISNLEYSTSNHEQTPLIPSQKEINVFYLPKKILYGEKITIEISKNELESKKLESRPKHLMLVENRLKKFSNYSDNWGIDCFGNFTQLLHKNLDESTTSKTLYFKGAYCQGLKSNNYPRLPDIPLSSTKRIYIVGNTPGEIIIWPQESWPEWKPVWMLQFKTWKKATAYLIGEPEKQNLSANKKQAFSKEKIKMWKKVSWNNRKRIKSNSKKQWKIWTERAKNV